MGVALSALVSVAWACGDDDADTDAGPGTDAGQDAAVADTGGEDAPDEDTGPQPDVGIDAPAPSGSAAFIAQGHLGRTVVSCDDGQTWVGNRSLDDGAVCWDPDGEDLDCDHHPGAGKGITFGRGYFYATWGWGSPGGIDRSNDGVNWERVVEETTYGGIAFGNDVVVAAARNARRSIDQGVSWEDTGETMLEVWNVRRAGYVNAMGGRFVMVADDTNVALSSDSGATWFRPTTIDASCGQGMQTNGGIAAVGDTILLLGGNGVACTSSDGGDTWSSRSVGTENIRSQLVWTGSAFFAYDRGTAYTSPDGETWSSQDTTPGDLQLGAVAYNPDTAVFVGVQGGWQQWYDRQVFYRSTDGVVWEAADEYVGQHPIRFVEFGYLESCPTE